MSDYSEESVELVLPSTLSSTRTASKTIPSPVPSIAIDKRIRNAHAHLSLIIPNPSTSTSPTPSPRPKTHPTLAHPIEYLQLPLASPHGSAAAGQGQEQEPGMRSVFGNVSNVTGGRFRLGVPPSSLLSLKENGKGRRVDFKVGGENVGGLGYAFCP